MNIPRNAFIQFLLTYGWVILIVFIGLAILANTGFIGIKSESCSLSENIECKNFNMDGTTLTLTIENRLQSALFGIDISIEGCKDGVKGKSIDKGVSESFDFTSCSHGQEFESAINFTYTDLDGNKKNIEGKLIKRTNLFKITV